MRYFFIVGEASGDRHTARLIKALKQLQPDAQISYWGGEAMEATTQIKPRVHLRELAFMGFWEVAKNIFTIRRLFRKAKEDILNFQPDLLILVDYPGFNLRIAKWAKSRGFKIVYYISPQLWAWNVERVKIVRKYVDKMLVILPFEEEFYQKYGVKAVYTGHPLVEAIQSFQPNDSFMMQHNITKDIIACVPGSRKQEISKMLPVMLEAAKDFFECYQVVIPVVNHIDIKHYQSAIPKSYREHVKLIKGAYYDILSHAKAAMVTSGTATLESALFGVPQVVGYKSDFLSYQIARRLIKVPFISLVNLIAGEKIVEELIQDQCNPKSLKNEILKLLAKPDEVKMGYKALTSKIGDLKAGEKAAREILGLTQK